jgi:leucyl/phenylalanyl-tRNA--protein transferase
MIPWIQDDAPFPPISRAMRSPNGLLCAGASLSPERIVEAYATASSRGSPRAIRSCGGRPIRAWCFPEELKVSRSLRKAVARGTTRRASTRPSGA